MTRMLLYILCACSVYGIVLFAINIAYNLKYVDAQYRTKDNIMSMFTITNVKGGWVWPALGFTYVISEFSKHSDPRGSALTRLSQPSPSWALSGTIGGA